MMAAIIEALKLFGDVKYTIGGREVPPAGSTRLPAAKFTFANVKSSETFFSLDLPISYLDAIGLTYVSAQVTIDTRPQTLYGWITGIDQISGVRDGVRLSWEIDHWRSYAHRTSIGGGRVRRCPASFTDFYVGKGTDVCRPVYQTIEAVDAKSDHVGPEASPVFEPLRHNWALFCYVTSGQTSGFCWGCFPIGSAILTAADGPSMPWDASYIYDGTVDEKLGLNPQSITGFWVIPFCPVGQMTIQAVTGDAYYKCDGTVASAPVTGSGTGLNQYVYAKIIDPAYIGVPGNVGYDLTFTGVTDDTHTVAVCNQAGSVAWALPYYPPIISTDPMILHVDLAVQVSAVDCQIIVLFSARRQGGEWVIRDQAQVRAGLCCEIPAVSVPVSSNAWSQYVYSGAREYDIESQKAQNEAAMYKGMAGAGNSAVFGALAGAAIGSAPGAIAGGLIGGLGQIIGSALGGNVDEGLRLKVQDLTDHYVSQQANGLLLPGGSNTWIWASWYEGLRIVKMRSENPDWELDRQTYGHVCDHAIAPRSAIGNPIGPWQIEDAQIRVLTGADVPAAAKLQIAKMLGAGVYVIERN